MSPKICFAMDWVLPQNTGKQTSGCHEDLKVKFPSLNIGNYRGTILGVASFNEGNIFGEFFCFFQKCGIIFGNYFLFGRELYI